MYLWYGLCPRRREVRAGASKEGEGMRPLVRKVPQLNRLAVFEAVGRVGTFTGAGRELGISQPAVSKHIAGLEDQLRLVLFERSTGRPHLTEDGQRLLAAVGRSFSEVEICLSDLRSGLNTLTIAVQPVVASDWLVPRMDELTAALAPTAPRLEVFQRESDLENLPHDVSIRFGDGNVPGMRTLKLLDEVAVPAASPDYANAMNLGEHSAPERLLDCELLEFENKGQDWAQWRSWFAAFDVEWERPETQVVLPEHSSGISLAVLGRGVILTWSAVRKEMFDRGLLVKCGPTLTVSSRGHHLVWPAALHRDEGVRRLTDWLIKTVPTSS